MATDVSSNGLQYLTEAVFDSAKDGKAKEVQDILQTLDSDYDVKSIVNNCYENEEITPLLIAAKNGHEEVVKVLLDYGADLEQTGTVNTNNQVVECATALWCACNAGHMGVVKLLLKRNADVNHATRSNSTPLRAACFDGHLDIVKYLIENGGDLSINSKFSDLNSCLQIACGNGHQDVVEYLLHIGEDPNKTDGRGFTSLHAAADGGFLDVVKLLQKHGTVVSEDNEKMTPLMIAADLCNVEVVEHLISLPSCSRKEKVEALELLATSFIERKGYDAEMSYKYLRQAMEERFKDPENVIEKILCPPVPEYNNSIECTTMSELEAIQHDEHSLIMECLATRERILGPDHPAIPEPLGDAGEVFADDERYDICIQLWLHSLKLCQRVDDRFRVDKIVDIYAEMFELNAQIEFKVIHDVLQHSIKRVQLDIQRNLKGYIDNDSRKSDERKYENNVLACLYLIGIMLKISKTEAENEDLARAVYNFIQVNPKIENGYSLLHICCDAFTEHPSYIGRERMDDIIVFPDIELLRLLINCGARVNAQDKRKNTPLHVVSSCASMICDVADDQDTLHKIMTCLIENGAHLDARNEDCKMAMEVSKCSHADTILKTHSRINLACLAARVVKHSELPYRDLVPSCLHEFIELH